MTVSSVVALERRIQLAALGVWAGDADQWTAGRRQRGPKRLQDLAVGISAVIAAPKGNLVTKRRNGRDAPNGPEARRPDDDVDACREGDRVGRDAVDKLDQVRRGAEYALDEVESLLRLSNARGQDRQYPALTWRQDIAMVAAG